MPLGTDACTVDAAAAEALARGEVRFPEVVLGGCSLRERIAWHRTEHAQRCLDSHMSAASVRRAVSANGWSGVKKHFA